MKKWILLLLICSANTCVASELQGAWKLVSGEYIDQNGKLTSYQSINLQSLKVLSESHFSFTSVKGDSFWAAGSGTYKFADGKYQETLNFNSFGQSKGSQFTFDSKLVGNIWYNSRWEGETRVEYEVWQRVE
ncbi:hypothetical protein [Neptunicella marina]|uniref:Extracellular endo-alpha-(1->5)-L-arabinanase C-terminal domain-containing protein n=1 Tax=Neptunicella marina TaxID=2125989 RepID=A0A8J6LVH4_9ALTE|nr:hypothetical protein [Neptunicella marina]MBC3764574.1 hypothetical protein [Neptunicella marina]